MTEINTFSAAVDDVVNRSRRANRKTDIITYVRTSIRECQVLDFFSRDLIEDTIVATASPHLFVRPTRLRSMRTARYNMLNNRNEYIYPKFLEPGAIQDKSSYFYYAGPTYFAFSGIEIGVNIDIAYYEFLPLLAYYELADRPATYSLETNSYSHLTAQTSAEMLAAEALVSNWLLFQWYDLIVEGAMAKIFKAVGDERAPSTFGLYKSMQKDLLRGEGSASMRM